MKKRLFLFAILLALLLSISVYASGSFNISVSDEFLVLDKNITTKELAENFGMEESELNSYISGNGIVFLAVNSDNTKQIRLSSSISTFSEKIENLSSLTEESIHSISDSLTGETDAEYEIVLKGNQTLVKTTSSLSDSGGNYNLTRYITVANSKDYVLSFYTSEGEDTAYIQEAFESFSCDDFLDSNNSDETKLLILIILASAVAVLILLSFVYDWIKSRKSLNE